MITCGVSRSRCIHFLALLLCAFVCQIASPQQIQTIESAMSNRCQEADGNVIPSAQSRGVTQSECFSTMQQGWSSSTVYGSKDQPWLNAVDKWLTARNLIIDHEKHLTEEGKRDLRAYLKSCNSVFFNKSRFEALSTDNAVGILYWYQVFGNLILKTDNDQLNPKKQQKLADTLTRSYAGLVSVIGPLTAPPKASEHTTTQ